jgi:decaprenylphospho-beta-D-ribofuranose 2-oxidase
VSFDGGVEAECSSVRPEHYRFFDARPFAGPAIPRGAGLSYAAASFDSSSVSIDHSKFDRFLGFSESERTVTVEAGMTLGELARFIIPRGFYLSVQPGHPSITIGGCVAADVHGKNHFRDGTFLSQVRSLRLFHPAHGTLQLGPNENPDLFRLTCGGYGLTGNIQSVTLGLQPIRSGMVRVTTSAIEEIGRLPELLAGVAQTADLVYTWHDFTCTGEGFGRGMLTAGMFADDLAGGDAGRQIPATRALRSETRGRLPIRFFNRWTTPLFNRIYRRATIRHPERMMSLYDFCFPVHDKQVYFKLFGGKGFHEFQHVVPVPRWPEYVVAIKGRLANHPLPVTLASAKLFRGEQDLLRFTGDGVCMAINIPRMNGSLEFAAFLDDLLPNLGAIPNIIKDSRLPQAAVARAYPQYELFRQRLRAFDPERVYRSELSRRLEL